MTRSTSLPANDFGYIHPTVCRCQGTGPISSQHKRTNRQHTPPATAPRTYIPIEQLTTGHGQNGHEYSLTPYGRPAPLLPTPSKGCCLVSRAARTQDRWKARPNAWLVFFLYECVARIVFFLQITSLPNPNHHLTTMKNTYTPTPSYPRARPKHCFPAFCLKVMPCVYLATACRLVPEFSCASARRDFQQIALKLCTPECSIPGVCCPHSNRSFCPTTVHQYALDPS